MSRGVNQILDLRNFTFAFIARGHKLVTGNRAAHVDFNQPGLLRLKVV